MKGKITLHAILALLLTVSSYAQAPAVYFNFEGSGFSGIWLEMTTQLGNYCQTAIGYSPTATDGLEDNHDVLLTYDGPAVLHTKLNNENLAVQTKGIFRTDDVTTLHYKAAYAGTFTLSLTNKTGVFLNGQSVYLIDKIAGTVTNLIQQAYFFSTEAGTFGDRFEIVYTIDSALAFDTPISSNNNVIIFRDGDSLNVDAGSLAINDVKVYDLNGRLIRQSADIGRAKTAIHGINADRQVLLVRIGTGNGTITKKIVF